MLLVVAATANELLGAGAVPGAEVLECGIGPIDAAVRTGARLAAGPRPSAVLHVGIAGARRSAGLAHGDLVIGSASRYCDTQSRLVARELLVDAELLRLARIALPAARVGTIGTSADVGGSSGCDVEAMEGFAVLRAAHLVGVPALEVRAISNEIEEEDRSRWDFTLALAAITDALLTLASALVVPVPAAPDGETGFSAPRRR